MQKLDVVEMGLSNPRLQRDVLAYIFSIRIPERPSSSQQSSLIKPCFTFSYPTATQKTTEALLSTLSSCDNSREQGIFFHYFFLPILTHLLKSEHIRLEIITANIKVYLSQRLNERPTTMPPLPL